MREINNQEEQESLLYRAYEEEEGEVTWVFLGAEGRAE